MKDENNQIAIYEPLNISESDELQKNYFSWLCSKIKSGRRAGYYSKLLILLYATEYRYFLELDENRAIDGIALRFEFADDKEIDRNDIRREFDTMPCSVLEMLVAFAIRCECEIMLNDDFIIDAGRWFWKMIENLGLCEETNNQFNPDRVSSILHCWMCGIIGENGEGGLFPIKNPRTKTSLRHVDVWRQLEWYLTENYDYTI